MATSALRNALGLSMIVWTLIAITELNTHIAMRVDNYGEGGILA